MESLERLMDHLNIYRNKNVFVTGHTGFKGSWLLAILDYLGATVKGYALPAEKDSHFRCISGEKLCEHVENDIRDLNALRQAIIDFQPDFVFHLAAQPLVSASYEDPLDTFNVNVIGTAHVLEVLRQLNKPCAAIIVTTDKVYQNNENAQLFKEQDPLGGKDPYSASKACTDILTQSYSNSFFSDSEVIIASVRAGNVIGGGDSSEHRIIPDIVRALSNNKVVLLRSPQSIRPWQHVLDCLHGYLQLAAKNYASRAFYTSHYQAWNFGPDKEEIFTVEDVTKLAIEVWGEGAYEIEPRKMFSEANYLQLDNSKSKTELNWAPVWDTKEAIEKTIVWYKSEQNTQGSSTRNQINQFFEVSKKEK